MLVSTDANMNVTASYIDGGASTSVFKRYDYTAYGEVLCYDSSWQASTPWPTWCQPLFCGYLYDAETGLYQVRHRYLLPPLGRWTTRDPLNQNQPAGGYQDGMSLYGYVSESPVLLRDPTGESIGFQMRRMMGASEAGREIIRWDEEQKRNRPDGPITVDIWTDNILGSFGLMTVERWEQGCCKLKVGDAHSWEEESEKPWPKTLSYTWHPRAWNWRRLRQGNCLRKYVAAKSDKIKYEGNIRTVESKGCSFLWLDPCCKYTVKLTAGYRHIYEAEPREEWRGELDWWNCR